MASRIGELLVDLRLKNADFIKGLDKSRTASTVFGVAIGSIFADAAKSIGQFAADAATALPRLVSAQIDLADQLQATSEKTNASVETLSVLQHQAELSNVSFESLTSGIGKFARTVADAVQKPSSDAGKAMQKLGVDLAGVKAGTVSVDEAFLQAADGIKGIGNSFEQASVGQVAFGKGFKEILPVMKQGREGFAAARKELELFGGLLTAETAKQADQFNDNLHELKKAIDGVGLSIAAQLLTPLVNLTNAFVEFAKQANVAEDIAKSIGGVFGFLASNTVALAGYFESVVVTVKALDYAIVRLGNRVGIFSDEYLEDIDRSLTASQDQFLALADLATNLGKLSVNAPEIKGANQNLVDEDAAKKAADELKKLTDLVKKFETSLAPASELEKELVKIAAAGKTTAEILDVYGDEIIKAVEAQRAHGIAVSAELITLSNQAKLLQGENDARKTLTETMRSQIEMRFKLAAAPSLEAKATADFNTAIQFLGELNNKSEDAVAGINNLAVGYADFWAAMAANKGLDFELFKPSDFKLPEVEGVEKVDKVFAELGLKSKFELQGIADAAKKAYLESGLAAEVGTQRELTARIAMLEAQREAILANGWTDIYKSQLEEAQKQLDKFAKQDALKDEFEQIGVAVSSGIEEAMKKWEGFGKLVIGILDDIAATILRNQVTAPLTGWLSGILGTLPSLLGGVGGAGVVETHGALPGEFPAFAEGGPVKAGQTALVGEKFAELFVPYGSDGAKMPKFPSFDMAFPRSSNAGKPFLIGKNGPEIFKPPADGTIIPLDKPEGRKILKSMQRLGLTRADGGSASAGTSYLTGERGMELYMPKMQAVGGGSEGNVTYITIDARGAEAGVEQRIFKAFSQAIPGIVQQSVNATLDRQARRA